MPKKTVYVSKYTQTKLDEVNKKLDLLKQLTNKAFPWHEKLIKKGSNSYFLGEGILSVLLSLDLILKEEGFKTWQELQEAMEKEQKND